MPQNDAGSAFLYAQIQRRMIESGEWDRISALFSHQLNETGWTDDMHHRSKEAARHADPPLTVRQLMDNVRTQADSFVSPAVKHEVMSLIRHYLETQIEK